MFIFGQHKFITFVSLTLTLVLTSCSGSKISQCQRLIKVVNEGTSLIETNKGTQVKTSLQMSQDILALTKSLEQMQLTDPKLKQLQGNFVEVFRNLSQAITRASQALNTAKNAKASPSGREKIEKARLEIDSTLTTSAKTAGKKSDELGNQLNQYCSRSE